MNDAAVCDAIQSGLGHLFECKPSGNRTRVRTPFLFPDGDSIDVYVMARDQQLMVSDLGETLRWLRMQTVSERETPRFLTLASDVCVTQGLEWRQGILQARCDGLEDVAMAVLRVAQGCVRVSDLWFALRFRSAEPLGEDQ